MSIKLDRSTNMGGENLTFDRLARTANSVIKWWAVDWMSREIGYPTNLDKEHLIFDFWRSCMNCK